VRKWADKAAKIIVDMYDPDQIILFGSFAKASENLYSDIDLIIVKDTDIPRVHRGREIPNALSRFPIKFDLLFITNVELAEQTANEYSFIYSILPSCIVIYARS
jgi:uncharacterized protein